LLLTKVVRDVSKHSHADAATVSKIIDVPENFRPQLGPGQGLPLETVAKRATAVMTRASHQKQDLIPQLLTIMADIIAGSADPVDAVSLEQLLAVATDIRGLAATLGSPITAYTANTIYRLAERALATGGLSRSLLMQLTEGNAKLLKRGVGTSQFEPEFQGLLEKLNAKYLT
jgi:hypothetical protein